MADDNFYCMQTQHVYIEAQIEHLRVLVHTSSIPQPLKQDILNRLSLLQQARVEALSNAAVKPLTAINLRYILTFIIHMEARDIATLFNVDDQFVYSVRYRLRKKFSPMTVLPL